MTSKQSKKAAVVALKVAPPKETQAGTPPPTQTIAETEADLKAEVRSRSRAEWEAWQKVIAMLRQLGAVTEGDLQSSVTANSTPGQILLNRIRDWGEAKGKLHTIKVIERG